MMRVEVSAQVVTFVRSQPPDARKRLRRALRDLQKETGVLRTLEGRLTGFHRLRVGAFRIIFRYLIDPSGKGLIRCEFAERRAIVYEMFEQLARHFV